MNARYETATAEETLALGEKLSSGLKPGDVIALSGVLGAGKTTLVKGLARGLGVQEAVTSPTFTLIQEYDARIPLYHIDLYRIKEPAELDELGLDEYLYGDGVTVIEWPEKAAPLLPPYTLAVGISLLGEGRRQFNVEGEDR